MKMKKYWLLYFIILIALENCTNSEKTIIPDNRNFSIVNMNYEFPIIDFRTLSYGYDSLGLTCETCYSKNKKYYLSSLIINRDKRILDYQDMSMGPSYSFSYDSNGRMKSQRIISCYDWDIEYNYIDTLGFIYQFSKIETEEDIDTTIYKLDTRGRVTEVSGVEYGDLYKRKISKKIYYSNLTSIPDSINTYIEGLYKGNIKESFYQGNNHLDSVKIEININNKINNEHITVINYFNENGDFYRKKFMEGKQLEVERLVP